MTLENLHNKKTPYICTPVNGKDRKEILQELQSIILKEPDVIEWRADFLEQIHNTAEVLSIAKEIVSQSVIPVIVTIRSEKEGGEKISLSEEERAQLLKEICVHTSVDIIDYEMSNDPEQVEDIRKVSGENNKKLILSYHNFACTPDDTAILKQMSQAVFYGADVAKVAVMPEKKEDVLRLLAVTKQADDSLPIPVMTMSMGQMGSLSRIIGWAYGSILTFAVGVQSSAPGQVPISQLKQMIHMMQENVGDWQ